MDAKTKKALAELARSRKIKKITDHRFNDMLMEFIGNWPHYRPPLPDDFSKVACKKLFSRWKSYLKSLGMRVVTEKAMERAVRGASDDIHFRDPATDWRHAHFGGDPAYIKVPREVVLRILALGGLP